MFGTYLGDSKLNTRKLSLGSYETISDVLKAMALTSHEVISCSPYWLGMLRHVEAHLLRVRISGKNGDVISVLYDRPHYVPVIRQSFQTIKIEIRRNSGN
ncbi:uncharacterized protein CDAR_71501 [Caerostris darwini]|uniref:Uncharacterized protein n=1 Tax=Caerostris darwini TaxID=1538125 RepID=A0AAV4NJ21_9ARAC|nr:uncharacterized protein CDAR_71501 [Caerostris darwini]